MKRIIAILLILIIAILSFAGCSLEETKSPEEWCVEEVIRQNELYYPDETIMAYYIEDVALYDSELLELAKEYEYEYCICKVTLITADNLPDTTYEHNYIAFITYEKDFFEKVVGAKWVEESWIIDCDAIEYTREYKKGLPNEEQINDFMSICRHIMANTIKPYNNGWKQGDDFVDVKLEQDDET